MPVTPPGSATAVDHLGIGTLRRRHAAVLFADLSGFTALVESAEPEAVYALVHPQLNELARLVDVHGGDIHQVLGDGFMAVFGLRSEPPGDAGEVTAAAVTAGLALLGAGADLTGRLPVHAGVECGEVLVSRSWEPAPFGVWGRTITTAARLCDVAGPHTLNIGPRAFDLGGGQAVAGWGARVGTPSTRQLRGIRRKVLIRSVTRPAAAADAVAQAPIGTVQRALQRTVQLSPTR